MDYTILDTIYEICPNDPAKAMTYIKECRIADDINKAIGTSYVAQLNSSYEGVDLLDDVAPPLQSKTMQGRTYRCGSKGTIDEIAQKALAVDSDALVSFAQIKGSEILEHVIGPASLLVDFRTRNGTVSHSISFAQLRAVGFVDVSV
jgi:hypothetical protein